MGRLHRHDSDFGCAWGFEVSGWQGRNASPVGGAQDEHAGRRSPDDFILTAGGRAPPFGDLGDGATAASADAGIGVQLANVFAGGWWARHGEGSGIEPLVPPDRCWKLMRDVRSIRVRGVDQYVAIQPCRDRRNDEDRRPALLDPSCPEAFANGLALSVPSRMAGRIEEFVANAVGDRDADIVLTLRDHRIGVNQLFEHRSRIILGGVDDRRRGSVPPPRIEPRALTVIDRISSLGIANPKTSQDAVSLLRTHTPPL